MSGGMMFDLIGSYCGAAPSPETVLGRWNTDPLLFTALVLALTGAARLPAPRRGQGALAVASLAVIFVSPLCAASVALFSARALHHLILIAVAAPLLACAVPVKRNVSVTMALAMAVVTLWAWHLPDAYDAALANKAVYWLMQTSLLGTAWLYWSAIRLAPSPVAMVAIVGGAAQMGMLGAILTFAPRPLYVSHLVTTAPFGIAPLADQQLAGLVMWMIGLLPYAIAAGMRAGGDWRRMAVA